MSKEKLVYVKGLFSALLVLTLATIVLVPLTSELFNKSGSEIGIYMILLIVWILLVATLGIIYLASEGSTALKPVPLPINKEEE